MICRLMSWYVVGRVCVVVGLVVALTHGPAAEFARADEPNVLTGQVAVSLTYAEPKPAATPREAVERYWKALAVGNEREFQQINWVPVKADRKALAVLCAYQKEIQSLRKELEAKYGRGAWTKFNARDGRGVTFPVKEAVSVAKEDIVRLKGTALYQPRAGGHSLRLLKVEQGWLVDASSFTKKARLEQVAQFMYSLATVVRKARRLLAEESIDLAMFDELVGAFWNQAMNSNDLGGHITYEIRK